MAAGGYDGSVYDDVDIFDLATGTWTAGTPLPHPIAGMASVPFEDTFLLVAGSDSIDYREVYIFDPIAEEFDLLESVSLQTGRLGTVAMLVDELAFPECPDN